MRIADQFKSGSRPTLSFEFFPPKDDVGFWDLYKDHRGPQAARADLRLRHYGAGRIDTAKNN